MLLSSFPNGEERSCPSIGSYEHLGLVQVQVILLSRFLWSFAYDSQQVLFLEVVSSICVPRHQMKSLFDNDA